MPKVSIIVPFYNVEGYIEKCLDTLVNQTLKDIEIILVNDGSKDNSEFIVKKYLDKYKDKIIYLEKENGGLSDARNFGIPHATGEYIAFLDSDDYVEKDMYEKMYNIAKKENSDMVQCNFYWEYPDLNKKKIADMPKYSGKKEMFEKTRVEAWNKLIKRDILEESKVEFPKGLRYEDVEFTYKLVPYINKVSFIEEPKLLEKTWENVNSKFPNWKKNEILKKRKTIKDLYLKSINKFTYKIYCTILSLI